MGRYRDETVRTFLDLFFPPACLACRSHGTFLCRRCEATLPRARFPCVRCAMPLASSRAPCASCRAHEPAFVAARAATLYRGHARDALMTFKLGGERRAAAELARLMRAAVDELRYRLLPDGRNEMTMIRRIGRAD
jgi:predicted amidophosphoribosyltransferase